jgi:hypothetical protein
MIKMAEQSIKVGIANEGEMILSVSVLKKWQPKNVTQIGDTVFFKQEDTFFSMKASDFRDLYVNNVKDGNI